MSGYREARDPAGRTVIALSDSGAGVFWILGFFAVAPLFMFGSSVASLTLLVAVEGVVFVIFVIAYVLSRRAMNVTIDPAAKTLAIGTGGSAKVLAWTELRHAQLNSVQKRRPRYGSAYEMHRVDVVLRTGEALPLMKGHGGFSKDDCLKLVARINAALGVK